MAFFGNSAINRLNIHYGVQALAQGAGGLFVLAYLLHAGVSVPITLGSQAIILFGRILLRPAVLPLAKAWGLRPLLILGALTTATLYPVLSLVHGVGWGLALFCLVESVADVLYWPAYHAYFTALGDTEHRGHQISAREALVAIIGIVAPLIGAWALASAGPVLAFSAIGLVQALSALPLIGAPDIAVAAIAPPAPAIYRRAVSLIAADGWFGGCYTWVWQVALFGALGRSLTAFGGAMALAALAASVCGMLLGRFIDAGHGRKAVIVAYAIATAVVVLRAASLASPWLAITANAAGAFVVALVVPTMGTAAYNLTKAAPCPFRFQIAAEGGWDIGCGGALVTATLLSLAGYGLAWPILLALAGVMASAMQLWRFYPKAA